MVAVEEAQEDSSKDGTDPSDSKVEVNPGSEPVIHSDTNKYKPNQIQSNGKRDLDTTVAEQKGNKEIIDVNQKPRENKANDKSLKSSLKSSKSVPLFYHEPVEESSFHGSETNLIAPIHSAEVNISNAKSYQNSAKHNVSSQSMLGNSDFKSLPSGPHKVQFVENENQRKRYISSSESLTPASRNTNISPSKSLVGLMKSGSPGRRRGRRRQVSEASSVSASSVTSESSGTSYSYVAPDGGYGWVVVAASFLVNMIADGVTFSFGVMFDEFEGEFGSTKAETAGVVAVFHAVPLLTGPLATWLTDRYGCRIVTIMGSILASVGFLLASFSHHIALLYLFFGAIAGFGLSLCYVAAIIVVAYYFDRRRSFATGISVCGSGVGTFLLAPFTQYLLDKYSGWRGACVVLSGVFLNMCICGMLFKELPWTREMKERRESSRSLSDMPEIEELRLALEEGDVSAFLDSEDDEPRLASSLITLPTYIKNSSKLPPDVLNLLANNKQTYNYILLNFPDSLIAKSISDYAIESEQTTDPSKKDLHRQDRRDESTGVKLARRVSSLLKGVPGPKSILKKEESSLVSSPVEDDLEGIDLMVSPLVGSPHRRKHVAGNSRSHRLQQLRMRRQSLTCNKKISKEMRSSSCPDMLKTVIPESPKETGFQMFKYFSLPFVLFCCSNCILYFWYDVPYVYTIEFAENVLKVPSQRSTHIISIIGILNTLGEVMVGWIGDQSWASSPALYAVCMLLCGVSTAFMPLVESYPALLGLSAVYGFCISANYSLTSPILVDLVSIERFSSAYGFLLASQGVANLIGPPFAGWLYDFSKQWFLTFGLAGVFIGISGVLLVIIPLVKMLNRTCSPRENEPWNPVKTTDTNGCDESAAVSV